MRDLQFRRFQKARVINKHVKNYKALNQEAYTRHVNGLAKTNPFTCGVPGCRLCSSARVLYGNAKYARSFNEQRSIISMKEWLNDI